MAATELLHRPALDALLTVATGPRRWRSRSELASDCGFSPSTFSNALATGEHRRGLSDEALTALGRELGIDAHAALVLPWVARPGDLRTEQIDRRLHSVQDELTALHRAFRNYQRGD